MKQDYQIVEAGITRLAVFVASNGGLSISFFHDHPGLVPKCFDHSLSLQ